MSRKGYRGEYLAKNKLIDRYKRHNVIKIAIGGAQDFIVAKEGRIHKVIEVKECHSKKWYPSAREKKQILRIIEFCNEHNALFEIWIKYPYKEFDIRNGFKIL